MRKKIIFYTCIGLLMASLAIATMFIVKAVSNKYETEETKAFREVLTLLENNRNKSNKKGYEIKFNEDFSYDQKTLENDEIIDYKTHYVSNGILLVSYETSDPKNVSFEGGFESFFKNANGFMSGIQSEKYEIHNEEIDKNSNKTSRVDDLKYETNNNFVIENGQTDLFIKSETKYKDLNDSKNDVKDQFYGKIARNLISENVESKSFTMAVDKMMFVDAWSSTNTLLSLLHNTFKDFDSTDYEKIYNYIKDKNFKYEKNDSSIIIKYELSLDSSLKEEENNFKNALIEIEVDKKTGEINNFKMDLSDYLASMLALEEEDSTYFKSDIKSYVIEGRIINNTLNKPDTSSVVYKEFNEENIYDFIDQFINHALPTRMDIY